MGIEFAARKAPDDLKSVEFAKADGSIRTMHAREGLIRPQDAEEEAALIAAGFEVDSDSAKAVEEARQKALDDEREANQKAAAEAAEAATPSEPVTPEPKGDAGKGAK